MISLISYTLPEIAICIGIIHLILLRLFSYDVAKVYAGFARFWLLISLFFAILFYNKSPYDLYFSYNSYTLLFILACGIFLYMVLFFSSFWFSTEKKSGCFYYIIMLGIFFNAQLMLGTVNLFILLIGYALHLIFTGNLLKINFDKNNPIQIRGYGLFSFLMLIILAASVLYLNFISGKNVNYSDIGEILSSNPNSFYLFLSVVGLIVPFLYILGITPFHVMEEEKNSKTILPVAHYCMLIEPCIFWGVFIKINSFIYPHYNDILAYPYTLFAVLSAFWGALGTNARINLLRIFSFGKLYVNGVILLLLSFGFADALFAATFYLFISLLAFSGLYIVFYNLKSHGEYLSSVLSLSGLARTRPYLAGALVICLFSLIGLPPMVGFWGIWSFLEILLNYGDYLSLSIFLILLIILSKAYLEIVKTVYFEKKNKILDSENKYILLGMVINILLVIMLFFDPFHFIEKLRDMFYVIFV